MLSRARESGGMCVTLGPPYSQLKVGGMSIQRWHRAFSRAVAAQLSIGKDPEVTSASSGTVVGVGGGSGGVEAHVHPYWLDRINQPPRCVICES